MCVAVMRPGLDLFVQLIPGALGGSHIAVTVQVVAGRDVAFLDTTRYQRFHCVHRCRVREVGHEIPHERGGKPSTVVPLRVRTHVMPAPALVNVAILAHKETVSNIIPTSKRKKRFNFNKYRFIHPYIVSLYHIIIIHVSSTS